MAMLPVGLSGGYTDAPTNADVNAFADPPPTYDDTDPSVRREGETSTDSDSQKSWTRTDNDNDKPTFKDALHKTERSNKPVANSSNTSSTPPATIPPPAVLPLIAPLQSVLASPSPETPLSSAVSVQPTLTGSTLPGQGTEPADKDTESGALSLLEADPKSELLLHSLDSPASPIKEEDGGFGSGKQQSSSGPPSDVAEIQPSDAAPPEMGTILQPVNTAMPNDVSVVLSSPAERVAVAQQVGNHMAAMTQQANFVSAGGQHTVTINVNPDHWGELKISLSMNTGDMSAGAKGVTATIIAGSPAVRDALAGQAKDLEDSLQSAGIKLDRLEITVANQLSATAPSHSASEMGFSSNSQSNPGSSGQASAHTQPHSRGFSADMSGQQRSGQQFSSLFGDAGGFRKPQPSWKTDMHTTSGSSLEAAVMTPIGLVEATSSSSRGVNVLA